MEFVLYPECLTVSIRFASLGVEHSVLKEQLLSDMSEIFLC